MKAQNNRDNYKLAKYGQYGQFDQNKLLKFALIYLWLH